MLCYVKLVLFAIAYNWDHINYAVTVLHIKNRKKNRKI